MAARAEVAATSARFHDCARDARYARAMGLRLQQSRRCRELHLSAHERCFFGHTHVPMAFVRDDGVQRQRIDKLRIDPSKKYFINTGSVGQPRDADWRAAYCIYHIEGAVVEQRRVKYDLATAQKKIIDAGLPRLLAERLAIGR